MADVTSSYDDASDVTHSTAFVVLNTLVEEGQIVEERAEYLKQKFREIHSRVLAIYKRDNTLLKRARYLRNELDVGRQRVQSRGEVARKDDEDIQKLKRNLIELEKDLTSAQQRESILQVEALELDRRKQNLILEREDAMAAEEARLRPKMESVQAEIKDMSAQIKEMMTTHQDMQKKLADVVAAEEECKSEIVNFTSVLNQTRQMYINVEHDPDRAKKQLQLITHGLAGAQKEIAGLDEKIATQTDIIHKMEQQHGNRSNDYAAAKVNLQNVRNEIESKRKTLATINTSLEVELEARQSYQECQQNLEQLIKATKISEKQEADGVERLHREKERCVREFTALQQAQQDLIHEFNSLKDQISLVKKDVGQLGHSRKEVKKQMDAGKKDIEQRTRRLLKEQTKEVQFTGEANVLLSDIRSVEDLIAEKSRQEEVKRRELLAVTMRRQDMNRDSAREASRLLMMKKELHTKDMYSREARRQYEELNRRLSSLMDVFHGVKNERSQKAAQIQGITQKMTEVAEKTNILENELEVLLRESSLKEKELVKKKRQSHEVSQGCTNLRLEKNKQRKRLEVATDAEKEVKAQVRRFNTDIATVEDTMIGLRDTYEQAVEGRNQTGIQLIDRNDELALLVEKVKAQEVALAHGIAFTNSKAEEIQALKVQLADLVRALQTCQKSIPKIRELEEELAALTEEIDDERWRTEVLENDLTDPNNPHRWRKIDAIISAGNAAVPPPLPPAPSNPTSSAVAAAAAAGSFADKGSDVKNSSHIEGIANMGGVGVTGDAAAILHEKGPSEEYVRLQARCQDLEARVNAIGEQLREKELILEEVTELSESISGQARTGREFTLALAKQVNSQQSGIRQRTRQMMATISELSLFQASSIQLQQEVQRLEAVVAEAEERLQAGDVPFAEAEEEYEREKESNRRYAEMFQRQRDERQRPQIGPNTIATTAVPRPNAYIPEHDLGIPRPYGPFAPFKPSLPVVTFSAAAMKGCASARTTSKGVGFGGGEAWVAATAAGAEVRHASPLPRVGQHQHQEEQEDGPQLNTSEVYSPGSILAEVYSSSVATSGRRSGGGADGEEGRPRSSRQTTPSGQTRLSQRNDPSRVFAQSR